jgi:hypothetical protein
MNALEDDEIILFLTLLILRVFPKVGSMRKVGFSPFQSDNLCQDRTMKTILRLCILVALVMPVLVPAAQRPNILFILADDLGWRDLSNEGSTFYESPNINKIAEQGMKFTRGYAACSVCSPSRASIMTGKYTPKHGVTNWIGSRGKLWMLK